MHREPGIASYYLQDGPVRTDAAGDADGAMLRYTALVDFDYGSRYDGALPYKSAVFVRLVDCATRRQDIRSFVQYHEPMARGEATYTLSFDDDPIRLEPPEPGSIADRMLAMTCARVR